MVPTKPAAASYGSGGGQGTGGYSQTPSSGYPTAPAAASAYPSAPSATPVQQQSAYGQRNTGALPAAPLATGGGGAASYGGAATSSYGAGGHVSGYGGAASAQGEILCLVGVVLCMSVLLYANKISKLLYSVNQCPQKPFQPLQLIKLHLLSLTYWYMRPLCLPIVKSH